MGWKIQHSKDVNLSKLIYSSMQFLTGFFVHIDKVFWNVYGKAKELG